MRWAHDDQRELCSLRSAEKRADAERYDDYCLSHETIDKMRNKANRTSFAATRSYLSRLFGSISNAKVEQMESSSSSEQSITRLNYANRFLLYASWLSQFAAQRQTDIASTYKEYNESAANLKQLRLQEDRSILERAYIVAMTTTGASRYHSVLKEIGPRIVIVEEAAEVFEAHVIAGLSKDCEHLILIGDHKQLRPSPAVYELEAEYHLGVSLFERLALNNAKKVIFYKKF